LGGSTPQTPRRGTKRLPRTPRALVFRWDAYTQLFIYLYYFKNHRYSSYLNREVGSFRFGESVAELG